MGDILDSLNEKQKEAVLHAKGPMLVIAGAGSGKTRALTHRIAYLIKEKGVSPWNILAVTFTNKAANEMKKRIAGLLDKQTDDSSLPSVGTFHATCVRILRKHIHLLNYESQFNIYDMADQRILMKHILRDLDFDEQSIKPKALLNYISGAKNELITPQQYRKTMVHNFFTERVATVYYAYQKALHQNNALDFDDIIMKTVELFKKDPKVLDQYQEKFKYISIDEYQDTNHAQYVLTNLLAEKYRNLCVIGDSDQGIYSFRGANITNILNFEKDYSDARIVLLEQNYRSTQNILDAAHAIISKNVKRKDKKLWTKKVGGEKIKETVLDNERSEAGYVCKEIKDKLLYYEAPNYKDFVVLYRTNAQSRIMEESFLRYGIPYRIVGGIKFYERKEIKDMVAYLRVIQNPSDSVSIFRIINTPPRKIGAKTIETIQAHAFKNSLTFFQAMEDIDSITEINPGKREIIKKFVELIKELHKVNAQFTASGIIKHVLDYTGYKKLIDDGTVEGESRLENIYELINVSSKYDNIEPGLSLNIFLEEIALIADVDSMEDQENSVTLMTIHSAKGLEFPYVFIIGLEEGLLPHSQSLLEREQLEEERRLMYVAVTRAREKLYLLRAHSRMVYGETQENTPSQFFADIPEELLEADQRSTRSIRKIKESDMDYTPIPYEDYGDAEPVILRDGDRVKHHSFGEGTVVAVTGGVASIAFDNPRYGLKKLALSIAPLTKIE